MWRILFKAEDSPSAQTAEAHYERTLVRLAYREHIVIVRTMKIVQDIQVGLFSFYCFLASTVHSFIYCIYQHAQLLKLRESE